MQEQTEQAEATDDAFMEDVKRRTKLALAGIVARARGEQQGIMRAELAEALAVDADKDWPELLAYVHGVRVLADIVLGLVERDDPSFTARRQEFLAAFGVAEDAARATLKAEMEGPKIREMLGAERGAGLYDAVTVRQRAPEAPEAGE